MTVGSIVLGPARPFTPDEVRRRCAEANLQGRMLERERCAKIADQCDHPADYNLQRSGAWISAQVKIAELIRKGE